MKPNDQSHRSILRGIARRCMLERGLLPDFSSAALAELGTLQNPEVANASTGIRDMRVPLWCSIDNDDSHDLDQILRLIQ